MAEEKEKASSEAFRVALSGDFLLADGRPAYPMFDLSPLDAVGVEYCYLPKRDAIAPEDVRDADALILLMPRFGADSIHPNGRLSLVARFGVGYDTVDVAACSDAGIGVCITPDGVRRPVAASIMTLMLALTGKLLDKNRLGHAGPSGWNQRASYMGVGVEALTLGIIGFGNIGQETVRLARPFGLRFVASDPHADEAAARELGVTLTDVDSVFREADIVSLSCNLDDDTRGLVDARRLELMKPTAYLINTARGPVVDQAALVAALKADRIAGAGLDVLHDEPPRPDDPILGCPNAIITPHALCWTDQCFAGIGAADVAAVLAVRQGREPRGLVDPGVVAHERWKARLAAYAEGRK